MRNLTVQSVYHYHCGFIYIFIIHSHIQLWLFIHYSLTQLLFINYLFTHYQLSIHYLLLLIYFPSMIYLDSSPLLLSTIPLPIIIYLLLSYRPSIIHYYWLIIHYSLLFIHSGKYSLIKIYNFHNELFIHTLLTSTMILMEISESLFIYLNKKSLLFIIHPHLFISTLLK